MDGIVCHGDEDEDVLVFGIKEFELPEGKGREGRGHSLVEMIGI